MKVAIAVFVLLLCVLAVSRIIYPIDLGLFESVVWAPARIAASGGNPYDYALREPYVMAPYGYFFYLVTSDSFWWGRLITVLAACLVGWSLWNLTRNLAAVVFLFSSAPFLSIFAVQRPDLLALACGALGFTFLRKNVYLAALLCCSAVVFKQTFFLMPVFVVFWYLSKRDYKKAFVVVEVGVLLFIGMATYLGENYLWQHFVLTRNIPADNWRGVTVLLGVLNCFSIIGIFFIRRKYVWYLVAAVGVAFFTSLRVGSGVNYYLETMFVIALMLRRDVKYLLPLLLVLGSLQVVRNLRAEYIRWSSLDQYTELRQEAAKCSSGISYHADLLPHPSFGDWIQYVDGRDETLQLEFRKAVASKRYECIVWPDAVNGYRLAVNGPLKLYVRE